MPDVYQQLAQHLDNLPEGFPATESGVELRILKRLFTPQEAELAMKLSMIPESVSAIAERLETDEVELDRQLEPMSKKGLIFRSTKGGTNHYMAAQFVVGIWEYHVNDLDEGLIKDFNEYLPTLMHEGILKHKTQQLRVIPVAKSISAEMQIMPYEEAHQIIKKQSKIVVAPCICRREHQMIGKGCDKPMEVCLTFGSGAYYYEENGLGREIDQEEALEILNKGQDAGLVLQPGNAQKPSNICLCCGCCCQILKNLKTLDAPAKAVNASYYACVHAEECTACGTCEERCPMEAIAVDDVATINQDRCIGCGVCVTSCDVDALALKAKDEDQKWVPPKTLFETYLNIAKERGKL